MTRFPALEASSFPHAFGPFLGGKLLESDYIDVHDVGVTRGSRGWGVLDFEPWVVRAFPQLVDV